MLNDKKVVLIADGEPGIEKSLALCLKDEFHVLSVPNGREAMEVLKTWQIDCLVADIDLPVMNGIELVEKVRDAGYSINTIMSTGGNSLLIKERHEELAVNGYIQRPYSMRTMVEMIRSLAG